MKGIVGCRWPKQSLPNKQKFVLFESEKEVKGDLMFTPQIDAQVKATGPEFYLGQPCGCGSPKHLCHLLLLS